MEQRKNISSIGTRILDIDQDSLIKHVKREYDFSIKAVTNKRNKFREQDKYINSTDRSDKIDLHTIYFLVNTQMALMEADEISVEFLPRQFGGEEQANNLTKIAKFDIEEMDLRTMNYQVQWNRLLRGVGIRYYKGFDRNKLCNVWDVVDTRSWVPDINGWYGKDKFRYEGFEVVETMDSLKSYDFDNLDKLKEQLDMETKLTVQQDRTNAGIANIDQTVNDSDNNGNGLIDIYHHFTSFNGRKYHVVLGNERNIVLAVEELLPVYENEKKNPLDIPFPTVHNYFSPKPNDPFGTSLVDLVITNHRYMNLFAHLGFIREKEAALGPDILVNTGIVRDYQIFGTPTLERRFLPVDGTRSGGLDNAFKEVPMTRMPPSNYNYMDLISNNVEKVSGVDNRQGGINPSRASTLGESNQIQANNNLRSLFQININNVGEAEFWKLNIRYYRQNFTSADKKLIRVSNSYGRHMIEFTRKDFISAIDPDVKIISKAQADTDRMRKIQNLSPYFTGKMVDPNASQLARSEAERKILELGGIDREEAIAIFAPLSYEERDALMLVELLNVNDPLGAEITDYDVDHNIYLSIFERAIKTPATLTAIEKRRRAVIASGQHKKQEMDANRASQISAMAQSQMLNQSIQGNTQNVVSRANLTGSM